MPAMGPNKLEKLSSQFEYMLSTLTADSTMPDLISNSQPIKRMPTKPGIKVPRFWLINFGKTFWKSLVGETMFAAVLVEMVAMMMILSMVMLAMI